MTIPLTRFVDWLVRVIGGGSWRGSRDDAPRLHKVEGLHKSYGGPEVLRGIDLTVAEHEVVCLIGASGSGKSTLLRCINLLEDINSGRIWIRAMRSRRAART